METRQEEIRKFIKDLESSINSGTYESAQNKIDEYFSSDFPCTIKITNKKQKTSVEHQAENYLKSQDTQVTQNKRNEKIFKNLIKIGVTQALAEEASTGVSTMEEANKKLELLNKRRPAQRK